jgi:type VI secretion system protein ImpH
MPAAQWRQGLAVSTMPVQSTDAPGPPPAALQAQSSRGMPDLRAVQSPLALLQAEPQRFGFFQAVRLLLLAHGRDDALGQQIRFRNSLALSFPASEIEALRRVGPVPSGAGPEGPLDGPLDRPSGGSSDGVKAGPRRPPTPPHATYELTPAFMGLLGAQGALPTAYTESLLHREAESRDDGARAFLDLFANRMVGLFHRAWEKHRLALRYERDSQQHFLPMALALAGLGQNALRGRHHGATHGVADEALAYFAGALQQRTLSAEQLQRLLADYLQVPVQLEPFVGQWAEVPDGGRSLLGQQGGVLGQSALLGGRVWQRDLRARLVLGPLSQTEHARFRPGGEGARALASWLTLCHGVSVAFEVQLVLQREAVRGCSLDGARAPLAGRLGWDTFLLTGPSAVHRHDVVYEIQPGAQA